MVLSVSGKSCLIQQISNSRYNRISLKNQQVTIEGHKYSGMPYWTSCLQKVKVEKIIRPVRLKQYPFRQGVLNSL